MAIADWFLSKSPSQQEPPGQSRGLLDWLRRSVGGWLGPTLSRNTPSGREVTSEKVRSGPTGVIMPWFLPYYNDVTQETQGQRKAYRQMLANPAVKAAVLTKILGVCSLDLKITPSDKKDKRAGEIADFVNWNLTERTQGGIPELVWSILSGGLVDGYSVCEKVLQPETTGKWAGKVCLNALKAKDVGNDLVLLTDEFRNVVGVQGLRYNPGTVYSPANFVLFRHLPFFDAPTGFSDFRSVYGSWWMYDTVRKLRAIGAEKRSLPFLVGTYQSAGQKDSLEAMLALAKSQNWASVPEGVKVEAVDIAGSAADIFAAFTKDLLHEIFLGILGAWLQSIEGSVSDGAGNSQVHKTTSDLFKWYLSKCIETLLNDRDSGIIKDLVDLNYVAGEYPRASLSAVDVNELTAKLQIYTGVQALGVPLSKEDVYETFGVKVPEDESDALKPPQPGAQPPGGGDPNGPPGLPFADATVTPFTPTTLRKMDDDGSNTREVATGDSPFDSARSGPDTSPPAPPSDRGKDMALAGPDGRQAEELLGTAMRQGVATLGTVARQAVERLLRQGNASSASSLFNDQEKKQLADALAASNATAELLGRARIRRRLDQASKFHEAGGEPQRFSEEATDFTCFAEPLKPMMPQVALNYFRSLFPSLNLDPLRFGQAHERDAFTLAEATDRAMLRRVKTVIQQQMEKGASASAGGNQVQAVLNAAGVTPASPQYAELVFRTNVMDAYQTGSHKELQDPDVIDEFPVWRYVGIRDGRQGRDHEVHFDRYYDSRLSFDEVRGDRPYNCRCSSIPIFRSAWQDLQRKGARMEAFAEKFAAEDKAGPGTAVPPVVQSTGWTCGAAAIAAVAQYFGRDVDEAHAAKLAGANPDQGTPPDSMQRALQRLGLTVQAMERMGLPQLGRSLIMGRPVLVCLQALDADPEAETAGHWVVITGRDGNTGYQVADPAHGRVEVSRQELLDRWHDMDASGRVYTRFGLIVAE